MSKWQRYFVALIPGVLAYAVMPEGPIYRQVGAAVLVLLANAIRTGEFES